MLITKRETAKPQTGYRLFGKEFSVAKETGKLDERKENILLAIIKNYLETGEPVGSRTISKLPGLSISSATIRNEMADLEELGYLIQPHTSAGRIPSDKGYRFYVDSLMSSKVSEVEELKGVLEEKTEKLENLLQKVVKVLAQNTQYTSLISTPQYRSRKVKFLQLTGVSDNQLLTIMVLEGNIVKNKLITLSERIGNEEVLKLNLLLNTFLQGLDLSEINLELIRKMKDQSEGLGGVVDDVLDAIASAVGEEDNIEIFTSGTTNIFKYPELSDMERASELLNIIEEKHQIKGMLEEELRHEEGRGIQVYIGNENSVESMRDCSVVTATYELEEGVIGKVGIIGPKRMDYEKVVGMLQTMKGQLDDIFHRSGQNVLTDKNKGKEKK